MEVFGSQFIKGSKMFSQVFEQLVYLFRGKYPSSKLGNDSITLAFRAMEFALNAEVYFTKIGSRAGKSFFNESKNEFLKHFDYESIINKIDKNDAMLFLYNPMSDGKRKISAHGVIGKFHSLEYSYEHNDRDNLKKGDSESAIVVIKLEISNSGIIDLPISDMEYFGKWYSRKIEVII
jgi:hypothetical protein